MFRNVFIGVDGTSHGRDAIALATVLAEPGARFTLVHVQPGAIPANVPQVDLRAADPTYYAGGREESHELLEAERAAAGVEADLITVPGPSVGPALHDVAEHWHADLLVVGACKHGRAGRILIGDDTRASVRGARCPVGVAPAGYAADPRPPTTIGVGFDFSDLRRAGPPWRQGATSQPGSGRT
ncbi:MAG TPA: universal stress protein [Solirubrobacteraceae bacterium]|nr:universal stress protein [Solirubrobacteraceae bacterium]